MTESYRVQLYILGFLLRFGPLHGYQLKTLIAGEASDFANIKLPNLYYHVRRMREDGLLSSTIDRAGNRPEREVYQVTASGEAAFKDLLRKSLAEPVDWEFPMDGALFFARSVTGTQLGAAISDTLARTEKNLEHLEAHRSESMGRVPVEARTLADLIFEHHATHYRAERDWLIRALDALGKSEAYEEE